jgi:hypothetical protein
MEEILKKIQSLSDEISSLKRQLNNLEKSFSEKNIVPKDSSDALPEKVKISELKDIWKQHILDNFELEKFPVYFPDMFQKRYKLTSTKGSDFAQINYL